MIELEDLETGYYRVRHPRARYGFHQGAGRFMLFYDDEVHSELHVEAATTGTVAPLERIGSPPGLTQDVLQTLEEEADGQDRQTD